MSKLLYVLKLIWFQEQFKLSTNESTACMEFGLFIALVYVRAWFSCTSRCDAPLNDLCLIKTLTDYRTTSEIIAETEITTFRRHLCYLGQELAPLASFSDLASIDIKLRMASCRLTASANEPVAAGQRSIKYTGKENFCDKTLDYFIERASNSFSMFRNWTNRFCLFPQTSGHKWNHISMQRRLFTH